LARESKLRKFHQIVASSTLKNIASALTQALESVLVFKPEIEAMVTHSGQIVFREDWKYFSMINGLRQEYNPFVVGGNAPGDVYCDDDKDFFLTQAFLASIWHSLDYVHFTNPLLLVMIADLLTFSLNEDQEWVKEHAQSPTQFMQNYVDLERALGQNAADMLPHFYQMQHTAALLKEDFMVDLISDKAKIHQVISREEAEKMYEARGKHAEEVLRQDFWDRPEVREVLIDLRMRAEKIVGALFPTTRAVAERSSLPAHGYDVFHVTVVNQTDVVITNLGDYRVLSWEMKK
jgi:hypothetical protein